jgi:hypothetical protein
MVRATPEFTSEAWHSAETASDSTSLLRFSTAGSVDDGKSTLIGRLLYDSQAVYDDQLASMRQSRIKRSPGPIDFSLLTDGLHAEREQGITIDVAYRYFSTPRRKFIIADTPGHEQYTRNIATGASTAETVRARVATVHRIDVDSLRSISASSLALNDIGVVDVRTSQPLFVEAYRENRATGSFILIDPMTNATVGAGIIQRVLSLDRGRPSRTFALRAGAVTPRERRVRFGHAPALVWLPRRSVAELVERTLFEDGWNVHLFADGDFGALGLTTVAKALHRAGVVVLFSGAEWPVEKIQAISGLGSFLKFDARERESGEGSDDAHARRIVEELRRWRDQNPECGDDE